MGEWRYISTILDLRCRWMWVVSFTPLPLYSREKISLCWLDGRQIRSRCCREEKNLAGAGNWTPAVQPVSHRYNDWVIQTTTKLVYRHHLLLIKNSTSSNFNFSLITVLPYLKGTSTQGTVGTVWEPSKQDKMFYCPLSTHTHTHTHTCTHAPFCLIFLFLWVVNPMTVSLGSITQYWAAQNSVQH
jgi:hypothetical protein